MVNFFPVPKKGFGKMRRCVDLYKPHQQILVEHFKMERLHGIQQLLCCDDLAPEMDLSNFYMHFLIGKADRTYMRHHSIGKPFGLAPAPGLATKMMAPVIRYLQLCGLRISIYIDDLNLMF